MEPKKKQIINDSINVIVSNVPGLGIAWELTHAVIGAGLKLRQQRALEWVEFVRDNPKSFLEETLCQEDFQDGFVFLTEKYLLERSESKRILMKKILLGFAEVDEKVDFELEKMAFTISQLLPDDIEVLKYVDINNVNSFQVFDDTKYLANIHNLINLGILNIDTSARWGEIHSPFVYNTSYGRRFISLLKK